MSKRQLKKLIEKNLAKAGFKKQPYARFDNFFLDSLVSQNENLYEDLRKSANLSREEMAELAGVSEHTIRRYESNWESSKTPKWYYILLRLVNGDLSFYGHRWKDAVIQHHDRKLRTYFSQKTMEPKEMNVNYNRHFLDARRDLREEQIKTKELQQIVESLKNELALSQIQNDRLSLRVSELENKKQLIEKGKLIPLFSNER